DVQVAGESDNHPRAQEDDQRRRPRGGRRPVGRAAGPGGERSPGRAHCTAQRRETVVAGILSQCTGGGAGAPETVGTAALTTVLIVLARVTDVSLDTLRTVSIVQGRRGFSALLGFCQALIYIAVISQVLRNFDHVAYAIAYAGGYALGTYLGIVVEQRLAF